MNEIEGTFAIKTYLDFEETISGSIPSRVLTSCRERLKRIFWQECVINLDLPLHPNIVTTYAVNRLNGVPYILMEFVDGTSLREVIADGPLPVSSVVSYVCQLAEGLKCAFSRNVLHRDIKPENILLTSVGTIKIADFGLARSITHALMHEVAASDTRDGLHTPIAHVLGTIPYIAPEQALDPDTATIQSDIYSCGVVLFELLTGRLPFFVHSIDQMLDVITTKTAPSVSAFREDVPPKLAASVARCLLKQPQGRFADYDELIDEVQTLPLRTRRPRPRSAEWEDNLFRKVMGLINLEMDREAIYYLKQRESEAPLTDKLLYAAGTAYGNLGQHDKALDAFDRSLLHDSPLRKRILFNKGNSLISVNQFGDAIKCYQEAVDLDPSYANAFFGLANAACSMNDFQAAIRYCERALALTADVPDVWKIKAISYFRLGHSGAALKTLETGLETCQATPQALLNFAVAYESMGNITEAKRLIEEFLSASPTPSNNEIIEILKMMAHWGRDVIVHWGSGEFIPKTIERLITSAPDSDVWERLDYLPITALQIAALLNSNKFDQASPLIEKELQRNPDDVGLLMAKAQVCRRHKEFDAALGALHDAVRINSRHPDAHRDMGQIYAALGRFEDALQCFDRAIECGGGPDGSYIGQARMLKQLGRLDEALHACELLLNANPDDYYALELKGTLLSELSRYDEARIWLANALRHTPDNIAILDKLQNCHFHLKDYPEAMACSDRILEIAPKDAIAWHNKGELLFWMNNQREALDCYLKAIALRDDMYQSHTAIGICQLLQGEYVHAMMYFDRALELSPDFLPAKINRVVAEARQLIKVSAKKRPEMTEDEFLAEVEELLRQKHGIALDLDLTGVRDYGSGAFVPISRDQHTDYPKLRERALQLAETGAFDEAIILLKKLVRNVPVDRESWHALGVCLDETGRHAEALSCFDQALGLLPSSEYLDIETLNSKGEALRKLGRFAEAISLYDEVLKHQPDHEFALNNKGLCLRNLDRVGEARDIYHRALSAHPYSVRVLGNLGQLEAQQGNERAALECCEGLKSLGDNDIMVHVFLSFIYSQLNKEDDVLAELEEVRALEPAHPILAMFTNPRSIGKKEFPDEKIAKTSIAVYTTSGQSSTAKETSKAKCNGLIKQCERRVAVYETDTFTAEIPDVEGMFLIFSELNSFKRLQTVYTLHLIHMRHKDVEVETHVTDFSPGGKVVHIITHGKGEVGLFALTEPIVAIVEIDGPDKVWTKSLCDYLGKISYDGKAFVYCHSNPLLVLDRLLREGCRIEWCPGEVGYHATYLGVPTGAATREHGVQMCLYWVNEMRLPMFHISDAIMTAAIERFCDEVIADGGRLRRISPQDVEARVAYNERSRFIDHPVFQYYLCGKTAATVLFDARKMVDDRKG